MVKPRGGFIIGLGQRVPSRVSDTSFFTSLASRGMGCEQGPDWIRSPFFIAFGRKSKR